MVRLDLGIGPRSLRIHWPLATPTRHLQPPAAGPAEPGCVGPSAAGPRLSFCPLLSSSSFSFHPLNRSAFPTTAPFMSYNWIEVASRIPCPVEIRNTLGRRLHEHDRGCSSRESSGAGCLGGRDLRDHALFERGADGRSVCGQGAAGIARTGRRGEVVVADNGSTDGSQQIAREHAPESSRLRKGYGHALRAGIQAARGATSSWATRTIRTTSQRWSRLSSS